MNSFNPAYVGQRKDIVAFVPSGAKRVLDIGCSVGMLGRSIKKQRAAEVVGIEVNREMANVALKKLDKVLVHDVEKIKLSEHFCPKYFDCIILADILEHLREPWNVLKGTYDILADSGVLIASMPNVRHYSTIISLVLKGYWPCRERGIHDKTHLRFFTLRNIKDLFDYGRFQITEVHRKYRIIEKPHPYNKYSEYFALPMIRDFLTFQYIVLAKKRIAGLKR